MASVLSRLRERSNVPLFAYGTLRRGQLRHGWVAPVLEKAVEGRVSGYNLMHHAALDYPMMVPAQHRDGVDDTVHGDLMWLTMGKDVIELIQMELNAGYHVELVDVTIGMMKEPIPALTFIMPRPIPNSLFVVSGDWSKR